MNKALGLLIFTLILGLAKILILNQLITPETTSLFNFQINPLFSASYLTLALFPLRLGLAYVFFYYGQDNIHNPAGFDNIAELFLQKIGIKSDLNLSFLGRSQGVLEIMVGFGLILGFYLDLISLVATILVAAVLIAYQGAIGKLLLRDVGLLGGCITLFLLTLR